MTSKQKQYRKKKIMNRATALKSKEDHADAVRDAEALEAAGKWAEAAIAWGIVADYAATAKQKKLAAGRLAAAKVRASAVTKSLEAQIEKAERGSTEDRAAEQDGGETEVIDEDEAPEETRPSTPAEMVAETQAEKEPEVTSLTTRNSRLPPVGTVLVKKDRAGAERARCAVVEGGIEYDGEVYKSLSAAGLKAMADLGLAAKTCDGFAFWGLKKDERVAAAKPVDFEQIEKVWDRYRERIEAAAMATNADQRAKLGEMLGKHAEVIRQIVPSATVKKVAQ